MNHSKTLILKLHISYLLNYYLDSSFKTYSSKHTQKKLFTAIRLTQKSKYNNEYRCVGVFICREETKEGRMT